MKRQRTYEQVIGQKLNGIAPPDVAGLWNNMEAILDREMPQQQKKKRTAGAWWFSTNLLVAAGLFASVGTVYTLCRVSGKELVTPVMAEVAIQEAPKAESRYAVIEKTENASRPEKTVAVQQNAIAEKRFSAKSLFVKGAVSGPESPLLTAGQPEKETETVAEQNIALSSTVTTENNAPVAAEAPPTFVAEDAAERSITAPVKEALPVKTTLPSIFNQQVVTSPMAINAVAAKQKKTRVYSDRGISAGFSLNLPVALAQQQKLELDRSGKKNQWQDYVPSVYAQLHLNRKFYLQAEMQPVVAQYTPNFTLYNRIDELNPDEKTQKTVKLNKLFYTSVPVSVHYNTPLKNLTVGVGMQYSKINKIILQDQEYYHLIGAGRTFDVTELKNEVVVKDPEEVRKHNTGDVVDSVAGSFRREDWRVLADVGYHFKSFNLGVRYTNGIGNYINTNFTNLPVKDRNESLQLYLRFNLFDSRKK